VRWPVVLIALTLLPLTGLQAAAADPINDKQAQAAHLSQEIEAKGQRVSQLAEQVDQARLHQADVAAKLGQVESDVAAANARAAAARVAMREQAVVVYVRGARRALSGAFTDPTQATYVSALASGEQDVLDRMRDARLRLEAERSRLKAAQQAASAALDQVAAAQKEAQKAVSDEQAVLAKVQGDLGQLVAVAQQQRAAADASRTQAALAGRNGGGAATRGRSSANAGSAEAPVSPGAAGAVEEARRQLGKPYRYGAAGPDSFDCSGLTMWAWGHAGRSLPHSAAAQYSATTRVPISALQPGDLVFYGSSIYHEGIYVGDGMMIEAPHTGLNVRYASIYRSDLMGAGRP
jgi:cell wall-associated NlpC family hydrolase